MKQQKGRGEQGDQTFLKYQGGFEKEEVDNYVNCQKG